MTDGSTLGHCPFCGGTKLREELVLNTNGNLRYIQCVECDAQGPWSRKDRSAVDQWNTRQIFGRDWLRRKITEDADEPAVIGAGCAMGSSQQTVTLPADLVEEIREFLEDYSDVVDGQDGPRPNKAMALLSRIEEEVVSK